MRIRLLGLLLTASLAGAPLVVPAVSGAAPHAAKKRKAKKAKKKAHKRKAAAKQGPKGDPGPAGPAGPSGTSVVARATLAGPAKAARGSGETGDVEIPLAGADWTQQPGETDDFAGGFVRVTVPQTCDGYKYNDFPFDGVPFDIPGFTYEEAAGVAFGLRLDGQDYIGSAWEFYEPEQAGKPRTINLNFNTEGMVEPDVPTKHHLELRGFSDCAGEGQDWNVDAVKIVVVGVR